MLESFWIIDSFSFYIIGCFSCSFVSYQQDTLFVLHIIVKWIRLLTTYSESRVSLDKSWVHYIIKLQHPSLHQTFEHRRWLTNIAPSLDQTEVNTWQLKSGMWCYLNALVYTVWKNLRQICPRLQIRQLRDDVILL